MNRELGIRSQQFGLLVGVFFFGYFLFEIPSNLILHKIGARIWITRILVTWGIVAMLTGFVHSIPQLYLARFLLGIAEAGFFPGIVLYLTYWFRQREAGAGNRAIRDRIAITSILGRWFWSHSGSRALAGLGWLAVAPDSGGCPPSLAVSSLTSCYRAVRQKQIPDA
jgi:ACS family tartrate transporter-like MFS transporter